METRWEVEFTDEFEAWWNSLTADEQESVDASVRLIEKLGPMLTSPHSSKILSSIHGGMRELRVQHQGRPYRVTYAFDPRRAAILLVGGDKTGQDRWYEIFVPIAGGLFSEHLKSIEES